MQIMMMSPLEIYHTQNTHKTGRDHMRSKYFNNLPLSCFVFEKLLKRCKERSCTYVPGNLSVSSTI
jgi:hypothetical protein